jgi:hypothetical protein
LHGRHVLRSQRGNTRHPLQKIERRPLGGQEHLARPAHGCDHGAPRHRFTLLNGSVKFDLAFDALGRRHQIKCQLGDG